MTDLNALPGLAFGVELRRLREAAGLTQKGLSDLIPYSDTLVGFVETGYRLPPAALVTACEQLFDARGVLDRLAALARVFGRPTAPLPDLLAAARGLRLADPLLVPGLLQTEDYAYALLQAANTARDEIDHVLATRPCLATLLDRSPELHAWLVLDETSLYRPVGGAAVLARQLTALLALAETGRLVIQLLPATSATALLLRVPVTLITFAEGADVAHLAPASPTETVERYGDAEHCGRRYDLLRAAARSHDQSLAALRAATHACPPPRRGRRPAATAARAASATAREG